MSDSLPQSVSVSASGKVLAVGGYAILEQPNAGLVLATSARFRTTVSLDNRAAWPAHEAAGENELTVRVISPQFNQDLIFAVVETSSQQQKLQEATPHPRGVRVRELRTDQPSNSYVRDTLAVAMSAIVALSERASSAEQTNDISALNSLTLTCRKQDIGVSVLLQADNDFYSQVGRLQSQNLPLTRASLATVPPFAPCLISGSDGVAKTGLGSSAAMITSLSAALMCFMGVAHVAPQESRLAASDVALVHEVAQVCHAAAQGKIGSGFDVCAAVYGSAEYVRYDKAVLAPLLVSKDTDAAGEAQERESWYSCQSVLQCLGVKDTAESDKQPQWDYKAESFGMPRGIDMACGDINGGSESPSMSRTVLAWKRDAPATELALWDQLLQSNVRTVAALHNLSRLSDSAEQQGDQALVDYDAALELFRQQKPEDPTSTPALATLTVLQALEELKVSAKAMRACLKSVGDAAKVPIEPECQTRLCDATASVAGVVTAGVPGAGGYDAVYTLFVGGQSTRDKVEALWETMEDPRVCPLMLSQVHKSEPRGLLVKVGTVPGIAAAGVVGAHL